MEVRYSGAIDGFTANEVAIVTGAARGVGLAVVHWLRRRGIRVVAQDIAPRSKAWPSTVR